MPRRYAGMSPGAKCRAFPCLIKPSRIHNLHRLLLPSVNDRTHSAQKGFESSADMRKIARRQGRAIKNLPRLRGQLGGCTSTLKKRTLLSDLLKKVKKAEDFLSFANPVFFRELRRRFIGELLRIIADVPQGDIRIYHIVAAKWGFPAAQLDRFEPRKLIESVRSNLTATGKIASLPGWAVVFVHNDYDERTDCFSAHLHVLVVGEKYRAFEALRSLKLFQGGRGAPIYRPIKMQPVNDPARQISYLFKGYWPKKTSRVTPDGRISRMRSRGMSRARYAESILFLHGLSFSDLVWMHGVTICKGRIELTGKTRPPAPVKAVVREPP